MLRMLMVNNIQIASFSVVTIGVWVLSRFGTKRAKELRFEIDDATISVINVSSYPIGYVGETQAQRTIDMNI